VGSEKKGIGNGKCRNRERPYDLTNTITGAGGGGHPRIQVVKVIV